MSSTAERRHHEHRVYKRRCARYPFAVQKHPGKTPGKACSCAMCGNPRKFHGALTASEMRKMQDDGPDDVTRSDAWDDLVAERQANDAEQRDAEAQECNDPACHCNSESGRCELCGAGRGEQCICALRRRATAAAMR